MPQLLEIVAYYVWLLTQWWFWLILATTFIVWQLLFSLRSYKMIDNELHVKHGLLGKWVNLERHLKEEHPDEWEELQRRKKDGS